MKLNPDCIRDILFVVEEKSTSYSIVQFPEEWPKSSLETFGVEQIRYHIVYCFRSGLLIEPRSHSTDMSGHVFIRDLSPAGHSFLANIREEENWKKTKAIAAKVKSFSLEALESIASGIVTALVNKHLGL